MPNTTENKSWWQKFKEDFENEFESIVVEMNAPEILNPSISCHESKHTEEPDHLGFVGLDFPFGRKKGVDNTDVI